MKILLAHWPQNKRFCVLKYFRLLRLSHFYIIYIVHFETVSKRISPSLLFISIHNIGLLKETVKKMKLQSQLMDRYGDYVETCVPRLLGLVDRSVGRRVRRIFYKFSTAKRVNTAQPLFYSHFIIRWLPCNGLLPPANEVWGKVIFSEACVKNSVHGGVSASVHAGMPSPRADPPRSRPPGGRCPPEQTPPPRSRHRPGSRHPPRKQTTPWKQTSPREADTPRKQTTPGSRHPPPPGGVRILLECNLVYIQSC